jgi:enoyl-CoA hydratase/carnithine racemase
MALLDKRIDGHLLILEIVRADCGNALNRALQRELVEAWEAFENDDELRVAVLQGAPHVFSIGHDVVELAAGGADLAVSDESLFPLHLSKPVIAAVEGPCYGLGFELALACDLRVAGEGAQLGLADPHLFVPYRVASVLLPRMTFLGKSLELIFSGRILGAAEMREAGLVSELAPGRSGRSAGDRAGARHDPALCGRPATFASKAIWGLSGISLPAAMRIARSVR